MLLAFSAGRSIRAGSKYAYPWEEGKLVRRPRRRSLCHRRTGLTFELVIASLNPALVGRKGGCAKGEADAVGYDAGKKVKGRKVHALVDTEGLPLRVVVHSAAIQDRDGAALVFDCIRQRFNWLELVWADGGYNARQVEHAVAAQPPLRLEIVKRPNDSSGFVALPRRWVVERTFSWFGRNRRLAKDYENLADTLAAFISLACIRLALRRLART